MGEHERENGEMSGEMVGVVKMVGEVKMVGVVKRFV